MLSPEDKMLLTDELLSETCGKYDGGRRNILVPECPWCGHSGYKFGIFVGDSDTHEFGSCHCFYCGRGLRTLNDTLKLIGREDLIPQETMDMGEDLISMLPLDDELDDKVVEVSMPEYYRRTYKNAYLKSRGFVVDDYEYFPVGTTRFMDWKTEDYVFFEIIQDGINAGYVGRHIWPKSQIDEYNARHRRQIRRYRNSSEKNGFAKLLYNYDSIEARKTDTVVLCEGIFDVIGLTRGLDLYDNHSIVPVATFGKKISEVQMFLLQKKGVRTVIIGYDNDDAAAESLKNVHFALDPYFDVYTVQYSDDCAKDFGEMSSAEMYDLFCNHIVVPRKLFLQ